MEQKVIRSGNSLAVTLPSQFVKAEGIKRGDRVLVTTIRTDKSIIYRFTGHTQLALSTELVSKS